MVGGSGTAGIGLVEKISFLHIHEISASFATFLQILIAIITLAKLLKSEKKTTFKSKENEN